MADSPTQYHVIRSYKGCYSAEELIRKIIRLHILADLKTGLETSQELLISKNCIKKGGQNE